MRLFFFFLLLLPTLSFAQSGVITGTVRDANTREALIGVSVQVVGTRAGYGHKRERLLPDRQHSARQLYLTEFVHRLPATE
ncbi:hypothetical protein [Pontibacter sp. BAB1700]|uniref:hypothetical protein n=1 Tax=Pontibacter sp. BAB1700 TaxID=1144253 RepID=UPI001ED8E7FF|nr:hypothetical protein [Pontibacter sp. BAB1700]